MSKFKALLKKLIKISVFSLFFFCIFSFLNLAEAKPMRIEPVSGADLDLNLKVESKDLKPDLSKASPRVKISFRPLNLLNKAGNFRSISFKAYEIIDGKRVEISEISPTIGNPKKTYISSFPLTHFNSSNREVFLDVLNSEKKLVSTYKLNLEARNLDSQISSNEDELANSSCDNSVFGKCQMEYILENLSFETYPKRRPSTEIMKSDSGAYKVRIGVPLQEDAVVRKARVVNKIENLNVSNNGDGATSEVPDSLVLNPKTLSSPLINGEIEFDGDKLYYSSNGSRKTIAHTGQLGSGGGGTTIIQSSNGSIPDTLLDITLENPTVNGDLSIGNYHHNVLNIFEKNVWNHGIKIKTNFPYLDDEIMPMIVLEGFDYRNAKSIGIILNWYIHAGSFMHYSASSFGGTTPNIQLAEENGKVVIFIDNNLSDFYFAQLNIKVLDNLSEHPEYLDSWSYADEELSSGNIVSVDYSNETGNLLARGALTVNDFNFKFGNYDGDLNSDSFQDAQTGMLRSTTGDADICSDCAFLNLYEYDRPFIIRGRQTIAQDTEDEFLSFYRGKIGINQLIPDETLDLNGKIKIRGGNPQAGYILQTDADGVGSWVNPSGMVISGSNGAFLAEAVVKTSPAYFTSDFVFGSGTLDDDGSNHSRFLFDQSKAAFRAGSTEDTEWDNANRGDNSIALGKNTLASGVSSGAFGEDLETNADNAFVIGHGNSPTDKLVNNTTNSLAIGFNSNAATLFVGPANGTTGIGKVGIGTTSPQAYLDIAAGDTSMPPLKISSSVLTTVPVDGAIEFDGSKFYFSTGGTRKEFVNPDDILSSISCNHREFLTYNGSNSQWECFSILSAYTEIVAPTTDPLIDLVYEFLGTNTEISIFLTGRNDVIVDWGDGGSAHEIPDGGGDEIKHIYADPGTYHVKIYGHLDQFGNTASTGKNINALKAVAGWKIHNGIKSLAGAFKGAINLEDVPNELPQSVTSLAYTFNDAKKFNDPDISNWTTINVTNMSEMFREADFFNQELNFNTSNVTNMSRMFYGATAFNQPLNWNTSKVTNMYGMFWSASAFNQPLNFSDTSKVANMYGMFQSASAFNKPLNFDTSSVTNMGTMFQSASAFNQPLNFSDTSKVANMYAMFFGASAFNQPLTFDTSSVTNMASMFYGASAFNQPLNFSDTSKVTNMSGMFYGASAFNQPLNFDTSSVTNMSFVFFGVSDFNQPLNWNTSKVTSMTAMFYGARSFNQQLDWDTSSVDHMIDMFREASSFNQPVNFTDTSKVLYMQNMFYNASSFNQPLNFDTSSVTNMASMFYGASAFNQPLNFDTSSVTNMSFVFFGVSDFNQPLNWNTSKVTSMTAMFYGARSFNQQLDWDTSSVDHMIDMFREASSFNQPVNFTDTSKVLYMQNMFYNASAFNQPLTFDTSSVTNMASMFYGASSFNWPLNWDTSKVTNMYAMFYNASNFNQDISNWDTSKVTRMDFLFYRAISFNWPLNWDTSSVTNMGSMFNTASAFNQSLNTWDTSKVTNMSNMFLNAINFTNGNQPLNWDTSSVLTMEGMFNAANLYIQPLDSFNTSNVINMNNMFSATAYNQDLSAWCVSNIPVEPTGFGGAFSPLTNKPDWGNCP